LPKNKKGQQACYKSWTCFVKLNAPRTGWPHPRRFGTTDGGILCGPELQIGALLVPQTA
jgi:hypothetical protein